MIDQIIIKPENNNENKEIWINHFAQRCFLETADSEYVIARLAFRSELYLQFYWSSLHAIEKYLKTILIFNRISTKKLGHNVNSQIIGKVRELGIDPLKHSSDRTHSFFQSLEAYGNNRYLDNSWHVIGNELDLLDELVSATRRYCCDLRRHTSMKVNDDIFNKEVDRIAQLNSKEAYYGCNFSAIYEKSTPFKKDALNWNNRYFNLELMETECSLPPRIAASNTPFYYMWPKEADNDKPNKINAAQKLALYELRNLIDSKVFKELP